MPPVKVLDCTLRDGGYYNGWDFGESLVADYLRAMKAARPDAVEIGFRFRSGGRYLGPFAYTPESYLDTLPLPDGAELAVMINEAEYSASDSPEAALDDGFVAAAESRLSLVRVATTRERIDNAAGIVRHLAEKGYRTTLNVMQIAGASRAALQEIARVAASANPDVLYFADSTGSLQPADVTAIVDALRSEWRGALGLHAHDNMQLALANCMAAADAGVEWIDGTVLGMGRGPGNARTENLLLAFADRDDHARDLAPLFQCMRDWFEPMRERYGWGSNPYYFLAGRHRIHPTYIQAMLADSRYGADDTLAAIEFLRERGATRYSDANLEQAGNFYGTEAGGRWTPAREIEGREVLVLGSGPGCAEHRSAIEQYIRGQGPYVIALNLDSPIDDGLIGVHAACHPIRLLRDAPRYAELGRRLVCPLSALPERVQRELADVDCRDFGLALDDEFAFGHSHARLPRPMAAAYALAIANAGNATGIRMAGFDGYGPEDARNLEMNELLERYFQVVDSVPLVAITPTRYDLPTDSVYRHC